MLFHKKVYFSHLLNKILHSKLFYSILIAKVFFGHEIFSTVLMLNNGCELLMHVKIFKLTLLAFSLNTDIF